MASVAVSVKVNVPEVFGVPCNVSFVKISPGGNAPNSLKTKA